MRTTWRRWLRLPLGCLRSGMSARHLRADTTVRRTQESTAVDDGGMCLGRERTEGQMTYSLIILAPTPHDHIRRTRLCLFRLFMRLIRIECPFGSSKQGRHGTGGISSK